MARPATAGRTRGRCCSPRWSPRTTGCRWSRWPRRWPRPALPVRMLGAPAAGPGARRRRRAHRRRARSSSGRRARRPAGCRDPAAGARRPPCARRCCSAAAAGPSRPLAGRRPGCRPRRAAVEAVRVVTATSPVPLRANLGADHGAPAVGRPLSRGGPGGRAGRTRRSSPACSPPASGRPSTGGPAAGVEPLRRRGRAGRARDLHGRGRRRRLAARRLPVSAPGGTAARWSVLEPLVAGADGTSRRPGCSAALAGATVASVHRQLGRHAVRPGLRRARRWTASRRRPARPGFDALLGLAADARRARRRQAAREPAGRGGRPRRGPRGLVAPAGPAGLGAGRGGPARGPGRGRRRGGARRGRARRALRGPPPRRQGPALPGRGPGRGRPPDEAAATLRRAALLAESLGTRAAAVAGPGHARAPCWPSDGPTESDRCLPAARRAVAGGRRRPARATLRADWVARADVAALLGA